MDFKEIEALVCEAKNQNQSAKELLAQKFTPFIINMSNKTFINGYDKQDIQNECYRILFKCVSAYDLNRHRFVAYATNGITKSLNDLIKKSKNRSSSEGLESLILSDNLEHTLPSESSTLDEVICNKEDFQSLQKVFNNLTPDEKELITFVFIKNNTLKNYAYWKDMRYSTANRKKKLLLQKMRNQLSVSYKCF